jgi:hypothetical protein
VLAGKIAPRMLVHSIKEQFAAGEKPRKMGKVRFGTDVGAIAWRVEFCVIIDGLVF